MATVSDGQEVQLPSDTEEEMEEEGGEMTEEGCFARWYREYGIGEILHSSSLPSPVYGGTLEMTTTASSTDEVKEKEGEGERMATRRSTRNKTQTPVKCTLADALLELSPGSGRKKRAKKEMVEVKQEVEEEEEEEEEEVKDVKVKRVKQEEEDEPYDNDEAGGSGKYKSPRLYTRDKTIVDCPLCFKECIGKYGLEHHFRKQHRNDEIPACFECEICLKTYRRYSCLQKHKRLTHQRKVNSKEDGDVECPVCGMKFSGNYVFSDHLRLEHENVDIRPFICEICGLPNRTANALRNHKKKHLSTRGEFACEHCNMHFPKFTGLERHQRQRHGEVSDAVRAMQPREHLCPLCGEMFSYQKHLDTHLECDHADDKTGNFPCEICLKLFKTHRAMMAHKKSHTQNPVDARTSEARNKFPCDQCYRRFEKWEGLIFHQRQVHQNVTQTAKELEKEINYGVKCPMCENYFKGNHALSQHVLRDHPEFDGVLFSCTDCGLGFKHYARLRQHRTHKHGVPVKFKQGYLKANPELRRIREAERRTQSANKMKDRKKSNRMDPKVEVKEEPIDPDESMEGESSADWTIAGLDFSALNSSILSGMSGVDGENGDWQGENDDVEDNNEEEDVPLLPPPIIRSPIVVGRKVGTMAALEMLAKAAAERSAAMGMEEEMEEGEESEHKQATATVEVKGGEEIAVK